MLVTRLISRLSIRTHSYSPATEADNVLEEAVTGGLTQRRHDLFNRLIHWPEKHDSHQFCVISVKFLAEFTQFKQLVKLVDASFAHSTPDSAIFERYSERRETDMTTNRRVRNKQRHNVPLRFDPAKLKRHPPEGRGISPRHNPRCRISSLHGPGRIV